MDVEDDVDKVYSPRYQSLTEAEKFFQVTFRENDFGYRCDVYTACGSKAIEVAERKIGGVFATEIVSSSINSTRFSYPPILKGQYRDILR